MKSRLVARGDLSSLFGRSDSPTADKEAVFLVLSFAASNGYEIKSGDLDHGYFQGEKLSKPLILRQPKSGLPDPSIKPDDRLMAFVPIYGTKDAGRGLWRRIRRVLLSHGFRENYVMKALYSYTKNGTVQCLMASHVDDIIWANSPEAEGALTEIKKELIFGKEDAKKFRFCGTEIEQQDDFTIRITCEQTSKKLETIPLSKERKQEVDSPATREEQSQLMSVVGSLMWISRSCRPGISYRVSKLQTAVRKPVVSDIILANQVVRFVQQDPTVGLTYRPGLRWPKSGERVQICIAAVSDASHGNDEEYIDEWEEREAFRSQGAKLIFLADIDMTDDNKTKAMVHLVSFSSNVQKRVVNSTIKAETYQLAEVIESADLIRAAMADIHEKIDRRDWENSSAAFMKSVWSTDCRSCYDTLQRPIAKTVNKRLGMQLAELRQYLWRAKGSSLPDQTTLEDRPAEPTDQIRWVDTLVMVADALTKAMRDDLLQKVINTNVWDYTQTEDMKYVKTRKQKARSKANADTGSEDDRRDD